MSTTTVIQITPSVSLQKALSKFVPPPLPVVLDTTPPNKMGRLNYFGAFLGCFLFSGVLQEYYKHINESGTITAFTFVVMLVLMLLTFAVALMLRFYRLKNIGYNGWWTLLSILPVVALGVDLVCLILPTNYRTIRKLDTAAQAILVILVSILILAVMFVSVLFLKS